MTKKCVTKKVCVTRNVCMTKKVYVTRELCGTRGVCVTKKDCVTRKVVQLFLCRFIFLKLTAGMPRRGCLIPLIALSLDGVFEAASRLAFPLS